MGGTCLNLHGGKRQTGASIFLLNNWFKFGFLVKVRLVPVTLFKPPHILFNRARPCGEHDSNLNVGVLSLMLLSGHVAGGGGAVML